MAALTVPVGNSCLSPRHSIPAVNPYYSGPPSENFDGLRFFNPGHPATDRGLSDFLRWRLKERSAEWPHSVPVRQAVPDARVAALRVTIVGHASVLIQAGGLYVLTDPWFMSPQHTDPNEAVRILEDLEAARAVGIHWGVFKLTNERRDEPPELLLEALARHGVARELFPAGEPGLSY